MIRAREKHKTSAREMNNRACLKTPPSSCVDAPYRVGSAGTDLHASRRLGAQQQRQLGGKEDELHRAGNAALQWGSFSA